MLRDLNNLVIRYYKENIDVIQNYLWRTLQVFGKQGTSFVIFLIATNYLTKTDMGVYNYIISFITLLSIFADLGVSTATSKYVAEYAVTSKKKLRRVLFNSASMILLLTVVTTVVTLIFGRSWLGENYQYFVYALPILALSPLTSLYDGIYRGEKKFKELAFYAVGVGVFATALSIPIITAYGLYGAIIAQIILYAVLLIVMAVQYRDFEMKFDKVVIKDIFSYSLAFGIATIGFYLFSRVNLVILGQYGYFEEIAYYELLNKIFYISLLPFTILGQVIAPYITQIYAKKDYKAIMSTYKKTVMIMSVLAVLFFISSLFFAPIGVNLFAPEYYGGPMWVLLIPMALVYAGLIFSAPINSGIIVSTGYAGISTWLNIITGVINVALSIWFIERMGYVGSVYAMLISQSFAIVVLNWIYYKKIKILTMLDETA